MERKDSYVYAHFDSENRCRYIGKGRLNRAWTFCQRSLGWKSVFGSNKPSVVLLEKGLSELEAYQREAHFVAEMLLKGEPLVNVAAGGITDVWDKRASRILSEMRKGDLSCWRGIKRDKETISALMAGKAKWIGENGHPWAGKKRSLLDPETMRKLNEAGQSAQTRAKARITQLSNGWSPSPEHRAAISEKLTGTHLSAETKANISSAKKGKPNGLKGRVMPEEHRKKIAESRLNSEAVKASGAKIWETRRANGTANGFTTSKAKAVKCLTTGEVFRSAQEAAMAKGASAKHIQACCTGRRKMHAKLEWGYG